MQRYKHNVSLDEVDVFKALIIKQPFAQNFVTPCFKNDNGDVIGNKSIEIRNSNIKYRGDILICSDNIPVFPNLESGVCLGLVTLYDVKKVSELTEEEWDRTRIVKERRKEIKKGFAWLFKNPRRVIEFPIKSSRNFFTLYFSKGIIVEYPTVLKITSDDWKCINRNK